MANVAFDAYLPEILPECAGVPTPLAINAIRNACIDFCYKSLFWTAVQTPVAYTAGDATYTLNPPTGTQIVAVRNCVIDDSATVYPWDLDSVTASRPGWQTTSGVIEGFLCLEPGDVTFLAVPDTSGNFTPTVALAPTRTATEAGAVIYNQHLETIKFGALWKLKAAAGMAWTDPVGAADYEKRFLMGVNAATLARQKTNSATVLRIAPNPLA